MPSNPETKPSIAISYRDPTMESKARMIAQQLGLELTEDMGPFKSIIMVDITHIELIDTTSKSKPFLIDFNSGALTYRRQHGGGRGQAICRAMGFKNRCPRIVDATAGLGRDSFILASEGCTVTLFERNPILQILLDDGLQRGRAEPATREICERMTLIKEDALTMTMIPAKADVIYLDPMYPHRRKSSLVKKEMRIIRQLVGDDLDADTLLHMAQQTGIAKIVVKRPKNAPYLGNKKPTSSLKEKNSRFDIYLSTLKP